MTQRIVIELIDGQVATFIEILPDCDNTSHRRALQPVSGQQVFVSRFVHQIAEREVQ